MYKAQKQYRHEYKYLISEAMMAILKQRIENLIPLDSHVSNAGKYQIRSLYFDDYNNQCYYDNENGTDPREKFRIRIYNCSDSKIVLECKRKESEKTLKTSCTITKEEAYELINSRSLPMESISSSLLKKLNLKIITSLMHPTVIVDYERTPFVYPWGNVRITFDTNIMSSSDFSHFFCKDIVHRAILPTGFHLLEVKFDEYLPDFIFTNLQLDGLERTAFSKYYLCRKYNI